MPKSSLGYQLISSYTYAYMTQNLVNIFYKVVRNIKTMEFYFDEKLEFTII